MQIKELLDKRTLTPEIIAGMHGVPLSHILDQLKRGIGIEQEHTSSKSIAREIALDHLKEDPNYYTKLSKAGL